MSGTTIAPPSASMLRISLSRLSTELAKSVNVALPCACTVSSSSIARHTYRPVGPLLRNQ